MLLFAVSGIRAQVSGIVTDSTGQPLPFSNVLLMRSADSTVVTGTTASESGIFQLEKKENGTFFLRVLHTGYLDFYSAPFSLSDEQAAYDAGTIRMELNPKVQQAVEVVAQKPFMEQKIDRTVFNIDNSVIAAGNNALDLLRKLPGVSVDNNDNIQVRGKAGVLLTIDGRTSYLSGTDIANYLRGIDAEQIEKIEVITNPSAKYDASGNSIINIVLKKNKNLGFNGQISTSASQGFYYQGHHGLSANYHTPKWNFFVNENYGNGISCGTMNYESIYGDSLSAQQSIKTDQRLTNDGSWNYARAGADFSPTDKQTIGFVAEGFLNQLVQERINASRAYSSAAEPDSSFITNSEQKVKMGYMTYGLNYDLKIDTNGKTLSADLNYAPFLTHSGRRSVTDYYDASGQLSRDQNILRSDLPAHIHILAGKIDYAQPLGKKGNFETGLKASSVSADNNAMYYTTVQGVEEPDTTLTNHFIYDEHIYAAYANYAQELNSKISMQLGLRGEETSVKGHQLVYDSVFTRNYFNLFPSMFFNWKIDSLHTLNFSYSRRIDRPDYGEMNPFRFFVNPLRYHIGNPYLQPQISDNFELTHVFKEFFTLGIGFMHMTSVFTEVPHQDDSSYVVFDRLENFSTYNTANVQASVAWSPFNWFTTVSNAILFYDHYFSDLPGGAFSNSGFTWMLSTMNTISLKKNWTIEASLWYRSKNRDGVWLQTPIANLNIGIRKKFADGRGTVSLNGSDLLLQTFFGGTADYPGAHLVQDGSWDSRRVSLSLSWKFGKSQFQRREEEKSAADELNRAK